MSKVTLSPLLEIGNIEVCYSGKPVIFDLSLQLNQGEILSIVGESGSGKSTLIKAILGLLGNGGHVAKGDIFFKGDSLLHMSSEAFRNLRGREIGMVFQNHASSLCPLRTIGSQCHEMAREHRKLSRREIDCLAKKLFFKMNFKDSDRILNSYPFELSGGMSQRVGIAMSMLLDPELLLADEPTSALDVIVKRMVAGELRKLRDEKGTSVIMVTHDIGLAAILSDKIAVLKNGRLVEYGTAASITGTPRHEYTKQLILAIPRITKR